jgi:hypothetical protein
MQALSACVLTGSVAFKNGATTLGTAAVNANCQAVFSTVLSAAEKYSFTAEYSGDSNYGGGVSDVLLLGMKQNLLLPFIVR